LPSEPIDAADKEKNGKGDDDKTDDCIDKKTVIQCDRANCLGRRNRTIRSWNLTVLEKQEKVGKIYIPQKKPDRRHDDIGDE